MLDSEVRSRRPQRYGDSAVGSNSNNSRRKRGSPNSVLCVFAWLLFICAATTLQLHSTATVYVKDRWSKEFDPSDDDSEDYRARSHRVVGEKVPTYSPTWIATDNNSWSPTLNGSLSPTESGNDEEVYSDERSPPHPRVVCFIRVQGDMNDLETNARELGTSCSDFGIDLHQKKKVKKLSSIPLQAKSFKPEPDKEGSGDEVDDENIYEETDTCKYPEASLQKSTAPSICNDIHSIGFDSRMFERKDDPSNQGKIEYITMGGAKCVWKVTTLNDDLKEETVVFKSHKHSRFLKRQYWDHNGIDAMISGGVGNARLSDMLESEEDNVYDSRWNHILPIYHYCSLANIVPLADETLEEYLRIDGEDEDDVEKRRDRKLGPFDTLQMALQAARGLYQSQMYTDGKPTFVHADVNPSQYLLFTPQGGGQRDDSVPKKKQLPILQFNDFNQGRFLTRSVNNNEICPFKSCSKNLRGNRWHTPERFQGCVDQSDLVDTYSLGSVFFYLLTNGMQPFYDVRSYGKAIKAGELSHVPKILNLDHPAYTALIEVMNKCMAGKLNDRPSSLEVVQMLEVKVKQIEQLANT